MAATYTFGALIVNQMIVPIIIYSFIEFLEGFPCCSREPLATSRLNGTTR